MSTVVSPGTRPGALSIAASRPMSRRLAKAWLAAADLATVATAMAVASLLIKVPRQGSAVHLSTHDELLSTIVAVPVWGLALARYRLYRARNVANPTDEF